MLCVTRPKNDQENVSYPAWSSFGFPAKRMDDNSYQTSLHRQAIHAKENQRQAFTGRLDMRKKTTDMQAGRQAGRQTGKKIRPRKMYYRHWQTCPTSCRHVSLSPVAIMYIESALNQRNVKEIYQHNTSFKVQLNR